MPNATSPDVPFQLAGRRRILVIGGAGFNCGAEAEGYGGAVVRRLLRENEAHVFNLDKMGYASDLTSIEQVLAELGPPGLRCHRPGPPRCCGSISATPRPRRMRCARRIRTW